jgi:hypothetical protein
MMSARSFLAAALLALSGSGAMEWREPAETEALLAAAGFLRRDAGGGGAIATAMRLKPRRSSDPAA